MLVCVFVMISHEAMKCLVVHEIQREREIGRALTSDVLTQFDIVVGDWG